MSSRSSASRARHNATQRLRCAGPAHHVATKYNHRCARTRAQARRERGPISRRACPCVRAMERTPHGWRGFSVGPEGKPTLMQPVLVLATLAREQLALVRQRRVVCAHPVTNQARSRNLTFGNFPNRKRSETSEPETSGNLRSGNCRADAKGARPKFAFCGGNSSAGAAVCALRSGCGCGCMGRCVALRSAAQRSRGRAVTGGRARTSGRRRRSRLSHQHGTGPPRAAAPDAWGSC